MQSNQFRIMLIACSALDFCKWVSDCVLASFGMDGVPFLKFLNNNLCFGCGFFLFECFEQCFNAFCVFLLFLVGFRVLQSGPHLKGLSRIVPCFGGKSVGRSNGFPSKHFLDGGCDLKVGLLKNTEQPLLDNLGETEKNANSHVAADDGDKRSAEDCDGFPSKPSLDEDCDLKVGFLKNAEQPTLDNLVETKEFAENETGDATNVVSDDDDKSSVQYCDDSGDEDEVVDVMLLRKMIKTERQRADVASNELEKERMASATATEETMAMILRLQNEKSLIEMEFKQFQRLAEEKQLHDQEVIQSLRWIVMKHETERSLLEDDLRCLRQQLNICDTVDEEEGMQEYTSLFDSFIAGSPGDALISSRDIDLTPLKMGI